MEKQNKVLKNLDIYFIIKSCLEKTGLLLSKKKTWNFCLFIESQKFHCSSQGKQNAIFDIALLFEDITPELWAAYFLTILFLFSKWIQ